MTRVVGGGYFVRLLGTNVVVLRQGFASGGTEPAECTGKVGKTGEDFGKGGSRYENNGEVLCGGGASSASIWFQDMGNDPQFVEKSRGFPPQGSAVDGGHGNQTSTG